MDPNFATFIEETEIVVPWHRKVRVNLMTGEHEVISDGIPLRGKLASEAVWNTAGDIQQRTIDEQTKEEARKFFEKSKADRAIDRAEDRRGE